MVIGIKNVTKLLGVSIIACCAVLVCTMFVNFSVDLVQVKDQITSEPVMALYNAQMTNAKIICFASGGCLLLTSIIMLFFYIKHYIDTHKKEIGILKALGYSNLKIAINFWVFGVSVFIGTAVGFLGAFLLMPEFYEYQNEEHILPEIVISFHPSLLLYFVILPTIIFSVISICYAAAKLKSPVLQLLRDSIQTSSKKKKKHKDKPEKDLSFIDDLKKNVLKSKKSLVFFIVFASFCFSAMIQLSASVLVKDYASVMMGVMVLLIGVVLAFTTFYLAITTVINGNTKTISMMRVFGYSNKECRTAILNGYRPLSYVGFIVGTIYQHLLMKLMFAIAFKDLEELPEYNFDFTIMIFTLVAFIVVYEGLMNGCSAKVKKISVKEVMSE